MGTTCSTPRRCVWWAKRGATRLACRCAAVLYEAKRVGGSRVLRLGLQEVTSLEAVHLAMDAILDVVP